MTTAVKEHMGKRDACDAHQKAVVIDGYRFRTRVYMKAPMHAYMFTRPRFTCLHVYNDFKLSLGAFLELLRLHLDA